MYADVTLQVRLDGFLGTPFSSGTGVKQGDPLSPLLFGLLIDRIEYCFRNKLPHIGVGMGAHILQVLLYADDLAIMAESPQEMQLLLNCLSDFCKASGLQVNIKKSEIVVFNSKFSETCDSSNAKNIIYNNQPLLIQPSFIYLGTLLLDGAPTKRMAAAQMRMLSKAKTASFLMFRRCYSMGLHNVSIQLHLFDSLVRPILNFGCENWGPRVMNDKDVTKSHSSEKWHRSVLKQMLGVCSSTTTHVIMEELHRQPLCFDWLKQALRFWNKIILRDEEDLVYIALRESASQNVGWTQDSNGALKNLGCDVELSDFALVDVEAVITQVSDYWQRKYDNEPRQVRHIPDDNHTGFKLIKYHKWFAPLQSKDSHTFASSLHKAEQMKVVAQFRMCSHWLNCEKQRKVDRIEVPRSRRVCQLCHFDKCEDEMHLFECPFYNDIRPRFHNLFSLVCELTDDGTDMVIWNLDLSDSKMRSLMNGDGSAIFWNNLANYLLACKMKRQKLLDNLTLNYGAP